MSSSLSFSSILFLDIETIPQYEAHEQLPVEWKTLWDHKASYIIRNKETETPQSIYSRAGIYAEFGKIICISCGVIQGKDDDKKLLIKSFCGHDEKLVLHQFCEVLNKWCAEPNKYLCAHNGKEFDFPYLCRRLIVNHFSIPEILKLHGKKPWDVPHLDTLDLWKFGDYKHYTSLDLLCTIFNIPTPKDDIEGSQVAEVYYKERNPERIARYCEKDTFAIAQLLLRYKGEPLIPQQNYEIA